MVIDSSAIVAIVFEEQEADAFLEIVTSAPSPRMSALNWLETLIVVESRAGRDAADKALLTLQQLEIALVAFDRAHMYQAQSAWRRFGKGRHPAALNIADCAAYATAVIADQPLLYKGDDFTKTGIARVDWG